MALAAAARAAAATFKVPVRKNHNLAAAAQYDKDTNSAAWAAMVDSIVWPGKDITRLMLVEFSRKHSYTHLKWLFTEAEAQAFCHPGRCFQHRYGINFRVLQGFGIRQSLVKFRVRAIDDDRRCFLGMQQLQSHTAVWHLAIHGEFRAIDDAARSLSPTLLPLGMMR